MTDRALHDGGPPVAPAAAAATTRRLWRWRQIFDLLGAIQPSCGGYRTGQLRGQSTLVLPAGCFFAPGRSELLPGAERTVATLAAAMRGAPEVYFLLGVHAGTSPAAGAAPSAGSVWQRTAIQAAVIVGALVARGVEARRLAAVGYGDQGFQQETYDGPSTLAPGEPLVEVTLDARPAGTPSRGLPPWPFAGQSNARRNNALKE